MVNFQITLAIVAELVAQQFPQWAHLPIRSVESSGIDNRTFRLGDQMLIRLPSAQEYAAQVQKEQTWLPKLAPHVSIQIPEPIVLGKPCKNYPWNWSIYSWIEGESANVLRIDDLHLQHIATGLAQFLYELHTIDSAGGPPPGPHNFYRGDHISVYDAETRSAITELQDNIDADRATAVWQKAISSKWNKNPVWIHGDFARENILVKDGELVAVIDFGCMGIGDPACDLVIAWTFLKSESREIFKSAIGADGDTWARARGWALWKALITLAQLQDKKSAEATQQQYIIDEILNEHEHEKT